MTTAGWHAAWAAALDELELDVARAESLLHAGSAGDAGDPARSWSPPSLAGSLPLDLRERAAALLDRQLRAADGLSRAMSGNRRHAALAARLDAGGRRERPVFVDQAM